MRKFWLRLKLRWSGIYCYRHKEFHEYHYATSPCNSCAEEADQARWEKIWARDRKTAEYNALMHRYDDELKGRK